MSSNSVEPLVVADEDGKEVDLTPLIEHLTSMKVGTVGMVAASEAAKAHYNIMVGLQMGMQLAVTLLFGDGASRAFEERVSPKTAALMKESEAEQARREQEGTGWPLGPDDGKPVA